MLKVRIVAVLVVKNGIVVQSIGFKRYLPIGSSEIAIEYLNRWGIDEIVLLDIDATSEARSPYFDQIGNYSRYCQVPLAIGGGVRSVDDIKRAIHAGADKIVINTAIFKDQKLIEEGANLFGSQCIVASIDAKRAARDKYEVFMNSGTRATGCDPVELAKRYEEHGAGEILLTSIDRDGSKEGYDLELIRQVVDKVNIPVIVCGGVGRPEHFQDAARLGASAAAAANFFHYSEHSVTTAKSFLKKSKAHIRLDSYVNYNEFDFDDLGRAGKKEDLLLERLYVEYTPEEVI